MTTSKRHTLICIWNMQIWYLFIVFCDGNATATLAEYSRGFPQQRHPNKKRVYQSFHFHGYLLSAKV